MKTGKTLRDEGTALVLEHEEPAWKEEAYRVIETLAAKGEPFTSEDVWANISTPPAHHNSMGAVMNGAAKRFSIQVLGYRQAQRPSAHARVLRVWGVA